MKSQHQLISVDEFRLQLNELQSLEKQYLKQQIKVEESFVYKFEELPMSISSVESWMYFSMHLFWPLHLVFCYINIFARIYGVDNIFISLKDLFDSLASVGAILNGIMVAIVLLAIMFPKTRKDVGIVFILDYIGSQTYPYLRYLIEICLYSSALFATKITITSLLVFGLACFASMIQSILLQNVTLRKGQFCCKSLQYNIVWRISTIVSLFLGIVGVNLVNNSEQLIAWAGCVLTLSIVLIVCYYSFGVYIYRQAVPRFYFFFLVSSFLAVSMAIFFDSIQALSKKRTNIALLGPLFLLVLAFLNWSTLERKRRISVCPENTNIKEKIYFFFNKFQYVDIDDEDDCQVRGILSYHFSAPCPNRKCIANLKEAYDSKKKKHCYTNKIGQSKVSLIKFYVKCLYERAIQEDPQNIELRLDYVEFYYLKLKNIFEVLQQIVVLETKLLSPFQRLRLVRLKKFMKKECNQFSQDLYLHNLSMEKTLESQNIFENIHKNMDLVIKRYELFWKYIERNQVFLSDILDTIRPNFALVDKLNQDWSRLADYFSINRRWKFYFLCFSIFIKNEKLKPSAIEDFGNSVQYDTIFKTGNQFIDKTSEKQALYNPMILFEQNTSYLSLSCDEEKMLIRKVSNYFERNFDHQPHNLINSSLDVLLPPSIRGFHHKMFLSWLKDGKTNNDQYYPIREALPITSDGFLAPCFKFYKYYLRTEGEVEYIAMLKRNRNDQMLILANQNYEIQAITYSLSQKLKISQHDYKFLRGMSLLFIMPMLPKYTRFAKYISDRDEDFMENDDNQIFYRKQSTFAKVHGDGDADIIGMKKELNLTNLKMLMPTDLEQTYTSYRAIKSHRDKQSNEFECIRQCYQNTLKSKQYLKFRGEMYIRQKSFPNFTARKYYEIEINQLEENNRLQKLKMEEINQDRSSQNYSQHQIQTTSFASYNQVDLQLFLQLNKKKNKVVLFPSKNIFLKDQNNQLLGEIGHIKNINISVRVIISIFIVILIAILTAQIILGGMISTVNQEYHLVVSNQKTAFLLNSQYHYQRIQPQNPQESAFYISYYTQLFLNTMTNSKFLGVLYQKDLNPQAMLNPYYSDPYPYYTNLTCPSLDQVAIFGKIRQEIVALSRLIELNISDGLDVSSFHIFNNYKFSYYNQSQTIKNNLAQRQSELANLLTSIVLILGITEVVLIVICFIFILSRLFKVTNGFSQLLSIFIQMDNSDIKKILRYINYTQYLFNLLKNRYDKMSQNAEDGKNGGSSSQPDLDKFSTEQGKNQQQITSNANANLNKKLKKIQLGSQIKNIQIKSIGLIVAFLVLVGLVLFVPVIYSNVIHGQLDTLETAGFELMVNNSLPNMMVAATIGKYSNSSFYSYDKYASYIADLDAMIKSSIFLQISSSDNVLSTLLYSVYFQNFVTLHSNIINQTLSKQIASVCDQGRLNSTVCSTIRSTLTSDYYISRANTIQRAQLTKGTLPYSRYVINYYHFYLQGLVGSVSFNSVSQLSQAHNIISLYEIYLMDLWLSMTSDFISQIIVQMVVITALTLCLVLIFHFFFVQFLISTSLNSNYEMFKRMYSNLIPQFVINKEKIIKAKLIKEGFMIE